LQQERSLASGKYRPPHYELVAEPEVCIASKRLIAAGIAQAGGHFFGRAILVTDDAK